MKFLKQHLNKYKINYDGVLQPEACASWWPLSACGVRFFLEHDMADISPLHPDASQPDIGPGDGDHSVEGAGPHAAWVLLDEASEDLVRAEAIVDLLALEMHASRHRLYAAQIAGHFLRAASERISDARDKVRDIDLARRGLVASSAEK